jgi:hypothetical protein
MTTEMLQRYAETEAARAAVHVFVEFARLRGVQLMDVSGLIPVELTVYQMASLFDQQHGINREQLAAEREVALQPGAECACDN